MFCSSLSLSVNNIWSDVTLHRRWFLCICHTALPTLKCVYAQQETAQRKLLLIEVTDGARVSNTITFTRTQNAFETNSSDWRDTLKDQNASSLFEIVFLFLENYKNECLSINGQNDKITVTRDSTQTNEQIRKYHRDKNMILNISEHGTLMNMKNMVMRIDWQKWINFYRSYNY